jgi:uncharacterized membrane protein
VKWDRWLPEILSDLKWSMQFSGEERAYEMRDLSSGATLFAIIGTGLMAGVFFAFSSFLMKALGRLPANEGIAGMQSINAAVVPSLFLAVFLSTSVLCLVVVVFSAMRWGEPSASLCGAGALIFLLGNFLVTMIFNVPMNDRLASISPRDSASAVVWQNYLIHWTAWNHVRTISGLASMALLILGR